MSRVRRIAWFLGAPVRLTLVGLIGVYRITLSGWLGGQCRFFPSCSHYAEDAIRMHGALRGVLMAGWRIARCGPFTPGGVDRVPPRERSGVSYDSVIRAGSGR